MSEVVLRHYSVLCRCFSL